MKIFYFAILFFAGGILVSRAQTNVNSNAVTAILALVTTNPPPKAAITNAPAGGRPAPEMILIESDGPFEADLNSHWITYQDHVCVSNAQMKLTCEWLRSNMPQNGEHVTNIVAETNVVIDIINEGQMTRVTGDKGVYDYHVENGVTNETVTITGAPGHPPRIQRGPDTTTGDMFIYDLTARKLEIPKGASGVFSTGPSNSFMGETPTRLDGPSAKTNSPETNHLAGPK